MPSDKLVFTTGTLATPTYPRHLKEQQRKEAARARPPTSSLSASSGPAGGNSYGRDDFSPAAGDVGSPLFEPMAGRNERSPAKTLMSGQTFSPALNASEEDESAQGQRDDVAHARIGLSASHEHADNHLDKQHSEETIHGDKVNYMKKGQRAYYRDHKQVKREVWQPGDGDGAYNTEVFHGGTHTGRYRFFQSHIGTIVLGRNEPPKHVVLDDRAAYEISKSGVYSIKKLSQYWSHDFTTTHGTIRIGRPNRGRPAVVPDGEGEMSCLDDGREVAIGWALIGPRKDNAKYYFYGEKGGYTRFEFPEHSAAEGRHTARATLHGPHSTRLTGPKPKPHEAVKRSIETDNAPIEVTGTDLDDPRDAPPGHKHAKISKYLYATPSPPVQLPNKLDYSSRHREKRKAVAAFGDDLDRPLSAAMRASIRGNGGPTAQEGEAVDVTTTLSEKVTELNEELALLRDMVVRKDEDIAQLKDEIVVLKSTLATDDADLPNIPTQEMPDKAQ